MNENKQHKAGYVTIMGAPNVGKSTLLNKFLKQPFSITSPKKQTTRHRILGIENGENHQIVFSDTPGLISPEYQLHQHMMSFVKEVLEDSDIIIYIITCDDVNAENNSLIQKLKTIEIPLFLVVNKIDLCTQKMLEKTVSEWSIIWPKSKIFPISALNEVYVDEVMKFIIDYLPESPPFFPKNQLTDRPERFFVNEIVRNSILKRYQKELPYASEVVTHQFVDTPDLLKIHSDIYVERDSQKGILIGHKGQAINALGINARQNLEKFFSKKVFLKLRVKVAKNWRRDPKMLKRFGYIN
ncbi:MAG: GTPase Era [Flavobacteriaceae bacterium]|nr:GTPase Era [Flavobacteriaceae bacterium]